jgi:hypothetical protein
MVELPVAALVVLVLLVFVLLGLVTEETIEAMSRPAMMAPYTRMSTPPPNPISRP